jgi:hypothetical protein
MSQIKGKDASTSWEKPKAKEGFDLETPKAQGEAQSTKLKQMLAGLKSNKDI